MWTRWAAAVRGSVLSRRGSLRSCSQQPLRWGLGPGEGGQAVPSGPHSDGRRGTDLTWWWIVGGQSRFFVSVLVFNTINSNDWVQNCSQCSSSFKIGWWWLAQLRLVLNLFYNFETPFCPTVDLIFTVKYKEFWKCYILNLLWQISQLHVYTKSCMLTKFTFEKVESVIFCC